LSNSYVESDNSFSFNINDEIQVNSQNIKTEVKVEVKSLVETMTIDIPTQNSQIANTSVDNNPMTLLANIDSSQISIPNIVHKIKSSSITQSNTEQSVIKSKAISIENKLNDMEVNDCMNQTIDNNCNLEVNDSQQMECESHVSKNDVQNNELNNNKAIVGSNPEPIVTDVPIVEPVLSQKSDACIQTSPEKINQQRSGPINDSSVKITLDLSAREETIATNSCGQTPVNIGFKNQENKMHLNSKSHKNLKNKRGRPLKS
jgi:hypothetical protein